MANAVLNGPGNEYNLTWLIISPNIHIFPPEGDVSRAFFFAPRHVTYKAYSPTGAHGWIEDVVVDQAARGQGVGRMLTQALLDKARALGMKQV